MQSQSRQAAWVVKRGARDYEARWHDADGNRRSKRGFSTKTDCRKFAEARATEAKQVQNGELAAERPATVNALLDSFVSGWSRGISRIGKVPDPATVKKVTNQLVHARRTFGNQDPQKLRKLDIMEWRLDLSPGVRADAFRAFRQALTWGVENGLLTRNATDGIANPRQAKHERKDVHPFTDWAEVESLVEEMHWRYGPLVILLVGTGLRPEEALALHRSDIEWNHENRCGRIHVQRRFTGGLLKEGTKTGSERIVPFGQRVYDALRSMPAEMQLETPILFPTPRGGYIDTNNFRSRDWAPALRAAGLKAHRIYDCRSTFITWNLIKGVPVSTVALWAGTSSQQIESTYRRYLPSEDALAGAIDDFGAEAVAQ
jgi:integrase